MSAFDIEIASRIVSYRIVNASVTPAYGVTIGESSGIYKQQYMYYTDNLDKPACSIGLYILAHRVTILASETRACLA